MKSSIKNIFALIAAILAAAIITFSIIVIGHSIVPPPEAIDTNNFESIKSNFHLFQTKHFLFPLFAHTMGTFVASYLVSRLAITHKLWFALGIGIVFMLASLSLSIRIGHFNWIGFIDIVQYIPISFMGYKFWHQKKHRTLKLSKYK